MDRDIYIKLVELDLDLECLLNIVRERVCFCIALVSCFTANKTDELFMRICKATVYKLYILYTFQLNTQSDKF